ncbi:MAG: APC family permease [Gemmatimonadaceae bacterium]
MTGLPAGATELRRGLGLLSATMIVLGGIIGGGIFFTPSVVAQALPSGGWILAIWMFGGLVALAGALTYAELGAMLPGSGGAYVYIREAFGHLAAFLYGWMLLASIATGAAAAVSVAFAEYVGRFADISRLGGSSVLATVTIAVLTVTNYVGLRPGAAVQNGLTLSKIFALLALIVGGIAVWSRLGDAPYAIAAPAIVPTPPHIAAGLAAAFVPVLFSIGGWQNVNMVAGEVRDPARLLPRALTIGIIIVITCYLGANAIYLRALGRDGLAASTAVAADTAVRLVGPVGATLITLAAMLSILGIVNVILLATPRVFYAMARDGTFLTSCAKIHPRFGTPHVAIAFTGAWSIALLWLAGGKIGELLSGVVFADWIFFGLGAASALVLRRTQPGAPRPYRVLGYPIVPAFFVLSAVAAVVSAVAASPAASARGALLLVLGALLFMLKWRRRK